MNGAAGTLGSAAEKAKGPALVGTATAAGLAGGLALGSRLLGRRRGMPVPGRPGRQLRAVAKEVGHVGRQIGKSGFRVGVGDVDMEVRRGNGASRQRQSPLEVLLHGLTSRNPKQ